MSAIGTANAYASDISPLSLGNWTGLSGDTNAGGPSAPLASGLSSGSDRDPATRVDLSDKVKDILARASTDQDVAARLKAFVESHRIDGTSNSASQDGSASSDKSARADVRAAFEQLSGGTQASDGSQDDQPVQAVHSFATGLEADGFTISALASDRNGSSRIAISGPDGASFLDQRFGTTGEFSGFSNLGPGATAQEYQRGNQEYITFSESEAAATNVAISSGAGTVSATSSGIHTASVTFAVDFNTGSISLTRSETTSVSTTVQIAQPGSALSIVA